MLQKLQRISFVIITCLICVISSAHAFNFKPISTGVAISSQSVNFVKANPTAILTKRIVSLVNTIEQTCVVANIFDAVEEVIEEDEDTESIKKNSNAHSHYSITQKAYQKAGVYYFYSPKSWYNSASLTASSITNKYLFFCVFRI